MNITKSKYYQLIGLKVLAEENEKRQIEIQKAVVSITKEEDAKSAGSGWSGEFVYSDMTIDELLSHLEIEVLDE